MGNAGVARRRAGNAFSTTSALAAVLGSLVSSSAWFTIAQRHKVSSVPQQLVPYEPDGDSFEQAARKRCISSSDCSETKRSRCAPPSSARSQSDFVILSPKKAVPALAPPIAAHVPAEHGEEHGEEKPFAQQQQVHDQAEHTNSHKMQAQEATITSTCSEGKAAEALEDGPAEDEHLLPDIDIQEDTTGACDPIEAGLDNDQAEFERLERLEEVKQKRQQEQNRQKNLLIAAFKLDKTPNPEKQQALEVFFKPVPVPEPAPVPEQNLDVGCTTPLKRKPAMDPEAGSPPRPNPPKHKRLRGKQRDPDLPAIKPDHVPKREADPIADHGPQHPEEEDNLKKKKKKKWGHNSRGDSINIFKKLEAVKKYEDLVKEHGKKIGSQKFYELKLPGHTAHTQTEF